VWAYAHDRTAGAIGEGELPKKKKKKKKKHRRICATSVYDQDASYFNRRRDFISFLGCVFF